MDIMELKELLKEKLGIKYLFPHQELVIMHIAQSEMNGGKSNILACLPTGSGKSICFMAPTVFISVAKLHFARKKNCENNFNDGCPN